MSECDMPGCGRRPHARGFCGMHYQRWRRCGDPVGSGVSYGAAQQFIDEAANHTGPDCLIWPYSVNQNGYAQAWRDGGSVRVHHLICQIVHGDPPTLKHDAAHGCGTRRCVAPNHLRWATRGENCADTVLHGRTTRGERHFNSKLTASDVRAIRAQPARTGRDLATEYGVTEATICDVRKGRSWTYLDEQIDPREAA